MLKLKYICCLIFALFCQFAWAGVYEDMIAAVRADHVDVIDSLLKRGFDANAVDREGNTLLMLAAREGSKRAASRLLAAHIQVNARNVYGESALMIAALVGDLDLTRNMLLNGAEPNQSGWTALMYAAANGNSDIARLLISYGARVNATADNGYTALMMAAREGRADVVRLLLAHGADPSLTSGAGATATSIARDKNLPAIVELLNKAAH